jgi:glutamate/tyrosine decarboxylase-like PLP-dependent enzyme
MPGPLDLTPEQMRAYGYRVIDTLADHYSRLRELPAHRMSTREYLEARLREPLPSEPSSFVAVLSAAVDNAFASIGHLNHPRFFGFIPTPSNYVSLLADALSAAYTPFCGTWLEGSGPAQVELVTLDWLKTVLGFPASAGGLFTSGGSIANLTAVAAMRESKPSSDRSDHVIYCSDQTHSSVDRAVRIAGYDPRQFRRLTTDGGCRLRPDMLRDCIAGDRADGRMPLGVVANAGTTNTGAVDPLRELAEICRSEDLWLHVDGAYGAAAAISRRGRALLRGIELADSVTLDPHKWLFQPYAMGCLLVREPARLTHVFQVMPEYLRDTETDRGEVNFCDYGPELTRPFRALKLWMSLKVFGASAFEQAIDIGLDHAEETEAILRREECWEIVSPASLAILCFRYRAPEAEPGEEDHLQDAIARAAAHDGRCFLSTTVLHGRPVLRMCTIHPGTTSSDLADTAECLRRYGQHLLRAC